MKYGTIILGLLLVAMAACMPASADVNVPVYTLCERNLSLDLGSELKIGPDEDTTGDDGGMFSQGFKIAGRQGQALLQIMDVYDEDTLFLGPEFISKSWVMGVSLEAYLFSLDEDSGDRITGNWTATDSMGNNVTVSMLNTSNSLLSFIGKKADLACWNIGENRYAGLLSFLDRNTTRQIIGTLKVE
jgi:hypothetical protein